jgi:hypothetical protein
MNNMSSRISRFAPNTGRNSAAATNAAGSRIMNELQFQVQLRNTFFNMQNSHGLKQLKAVLYTSVFKKPVNYKEFVWAFDKEWLNLSPSIGKEDIKKHSFWGSQIYETLKNAAHYGGDALIVARRYQDLKQNILREILEVIIWDNGPGIHDIQQALGQGYTSCRGDQPEDYGGAGKGIDILVMNEPDSYAANEIIIESGSKRVSRGYQSDRYHFENISESIPGTKVTLRFWLDGN